MSSNPADLSPSARIRSAAIELFGSQGLDQTTVRQIAARAGVSPGLVLHHFGSKQQLRQVCDDWVIAWLGGEQGVFLGAAPMPHLDSYVEQHPELPTVSAYLVAALREGGSMARRCFERLFAVTAQMLDAGEAQGMIRPSADPQARTALLVGMTAGLMMLDHDIAPYLGGASLTDAQVVPRYGAAAVELIGIFSDAYGDELRAACIPTEESQQ